MKRTVTLFIAVSVAMASLQGCYGSMALTRKIYRVNGQVQDKYVRSFVTWAFIIVPVYGVSALVDFVVFNTIEFWSGHNPVASAEKSFQYADNGDTYRVDARKQGDDVTYVINHFRGASHLDTMTINWDTRSGNSKATLIAKDKTTDFAAIREGGGVKVSSSDPAILNGSAERVALYR